MKNHNSSFVYLKKILAILIAFTIIPFSITVCQVKTQIKNISGQMGNTVNVCGTILSVKYLENVKSKPTLINLGGDNVDEHLDVLIGTEFMNSTPFKPDSLLLKHACVTGVPFYFKGGSEFIYLKAESIQLAEKEIIATPVFKEQSIQELNTNDLLQASHNRSLKRTIVFYPGQNEPQKKQLLIKYLKFGHIVSYSETKQKKTYVILLRDYMDD